MKIIIPAAGEGKRLEPHTLTTPKVLLPVAGKPIIGHILDRLTALNPEEIIVVVNPRQTEPIRQYLTAHYAPPLKFVEQPAPLGLGHAVLLGLRSCGGAPALIILGDTILELDWPGMIGNGNTIGVKAVPDPRRFGVVELKDGYLCRVIEKPERPTTNLAIVGVYYFNDSRELEAALDRLIKESRTTRGEYQLTDSFQLMIEAWIRIKPYPVEKWLDCGTVEALLETNRYLLHQSHVGAGLKPAPTMAHNTTIIPPVFIARSSRIAFSTIGPFAAVGENVEIENSTIRDSIIDAGAKIKNAVVEKSFIGKNEEVLGETATSTAPSDPTA
jgi:glucose-1-phosphate thymidylyltransferase